MIFSRSISSPILSLLALGVPVYAAISPNPTETLWAGLTLWITFKLFLWQGTPGVLIYALIIPFIEAHGMLLEANNYETTLNQLYAGTGQKTFWASSIGYVSVMLGFLIGSRRSLNSLTRGDELIQAAEKLNFNRIFLCVLASQVIVQVTRQVIPYSSSLRQIEVYIGGVSLALIVVFSIHHFLKRDNQWLFWGFYSYYIASSFYSYFSSWRMPLAIILLATLSRIKSFGTRDLIKSSPVLLSAILLVFVWQTVKGEYREFLSAGERSQAIRVSKSEALNKFKDLSTNAIFQDTIVSDKVAKSTFKRVGYTEYFASAMERVPQEIPFEKGKLLSESISFALIPRLLNPNKGIKNDRAKVERYTDYYFGTDSFASFSLGHYCEAYIDWGPFWMHLHLFAYGLFGAFLLNMTLRRTKKMNALFQWGILFAILINWGTFQQDMVTVLGRTVWGSFCLLVLFSPIFNGFNRYCSK